MIPGVWCMINFDAMKRFCSSQLKTKLPLYAQVISALLHVVWCQIFIKELDMKVTGAAIALNLTYFINFILLEMFIRCSSAFKNTYRSFEYKSIQMCGEYMKVGLYSGFLECLTWWNLDACFLFTGYLGVSSINAQVVIMQIKNFTNMIPTGVAFAASGLVGNLLGMN